MKGQSVEAEGMCIPLTTPAPLTYLKNLGRPIEFIFRFKFTTQALWTVAFLLLLMLLLLMLFLLVLLLLLLLLLLLCQFPAGLRFEREIEKKERKEIYLRNGTLNRSLHNPQTEVEAQCELFRPERAISRRQVVGNGH